MDIFTPIIGAIASVFTRKALENNSAASEVSPLSIQDLNRKEPTINKKVGKASGLESNKPKTIDPAQKKILFDELKKVEQGLTDFKKLLQNM